MLDPTPEEIGRVLTGLTIHKNQGREAIADCLACNKKKHLYVNQDTGLWFCQRCEARGNLWVLADMLGIRVREQGAGKRLVHAAGHVAMQVANKAMAKPLASKSKGWPTLKIDGMCSAVLDGDDDDGSAVHAYLKGRGFADHTIKHFKLCAVPKGGKIHSLMLGIPFLVDERVPLIKLRNLESKGGGRDWRRFPAGAESLLFNAEAVSGLKSVILVEAELDAISLWQLGFTNVVASSIGAKTSIPQAWVEQLQDADDIVIWMDDDEKGDEAAAGIITQLGSDRCRIASLADSKAQIEMCGQLKDPNDLLVATTMGHSVETVTGWVEDIIKTAKVIDNQINVLPSTYRDALEAKFELGEEVLGAPSAWPAFDALIKGIRRKELILVTGHTGHGKTTWTSALLTHLASLGFPVLMSGFEGGPEVVAEDLFQRKLGMPIHAVAGMKDKATAYAALDRLDEDPIYIIDQENDTGLDVIKDAIRHAVRRLGVQYVMLDHLHHFLPAFATNNRGPREDQVIDHTTRELKNLGIELDVGIFLICHPNGSVSDDTVPSGRDLKGASAIKQNIFTGITVYRPINMLGDPTTRKTKLKDSRGNRVEVDLGCNSSLISIWKARNKAAREGYVVLDYNARDLSFKDQPAKPTEPTDAVDGAASEGESGRAEDPFLW